MAFVALMDDGTCCEGWLGDVDGQAMTLFAGINVLRDGFFHLNIDH
jgi:hypothetical protein